MSDLWTVFSWEIVLLSVRAQRFTNFDIKAIYALRTETRCALTAAAVARLYHIDNESKTFWRCCVFSLIEFEGDNIRGHAIGTEGNSSPQGIDLNQFFVNPSSRIRRQTQLRPPNKSAVSWIHIDTLPLIGAAQKEPLWQVREFSFAAAALNFLFHRCLLGAAHNWSGCTLKGCLPSATSSDNTATRVRVAAGRDSWGCHTWSKGQWA